VELTNSDITELTTLTYELGGIYTPNTHPTVGSGIMITPNTTAWSKPPQPPQPVRQVKWTNSDGLTIDYVVHDDGTIHIDEDAFELMLEQIGFIKPQKEEKPHE